MNLQSEGRPLASPVPNADLSAVGVLRAAHDARWAAPVASRLASFTGELRQHTLLCNLEGAPSPLDRHLGIHDAPGVTAALRGDSRIVDIAIAGEGRSFTYLPAGDHPAPARDLLATHSMRRLVHKVRQSGGTILLYIPVEEVRRRPGSAMGLGELLDGIILLGMDRARGGGGGVDIPVVGHLRPNRLPVPSRGRLPPLQAVQEVVLPADDEPMNGPGDRWRRARRRFLRPYMR